MHRDKSFTFFWDCLNTHMFYNQPSASPLVTVKLKEQYRINPETGSVALLYLWHLTVHCVMLLLPVFLFVPQVQKLSTGPHWTKYLGNKLYAFQKKLKNVHITISGSVRLPCNMHEQCTGSSLPGSATWNIRSLFHLATIICHFLPLCAVHVGICVSGQWQQKTWADRTWQITVVR